MGDLVEETNCVQMEEQHSSVKTANAKILGSGEHVLVLSHGLGGDQQAWEDLLPQLSARYTVVVYDLRGHGRKNRTGDEQQVGFTFELLAADLLSILDELGVDKCTFVGHSVSGMVGSLASLARPQLFNGLILVGASPRYLNDDEYHGGFNASDIEQLLASMKQDYGSWVNSFARAALGAEATAAAINRYTASLLQLDPGFAVAALAAVFYSDFRNILPRITVPCHVIQARRDFAVPDQVALYLYKHLGAAEKSLKIVQSDGHLPHLTAPNLLIPLILELVDRD